MIQENKIDVAKHHTQTGPHQHLIQVNLTKHPTHSERRKMAEQRALEREECKQTHPDLIQHTEFSDFGTYLIGINI